MSGFWDDLDDATTENEWEQEESEERHDVLANPHGELLYQYFYPTDGVRNRRAASRRRAASTEGERE